VLISVVMPAYNTEAFIGEATESILRQTHQDLELIIVDDGSTDGTAEIIARYQAEDSRVRVVSQPNSGVAAARNAGIAIARSEWIAVMDSDDVMESNRLERQLAFVEKNPDLAIAASLVTWINHDGREIGRSQSSLLTDEAVNEAYRRDPVIILSHPTCMIRREVLLDVGGYRTQFWASSDIDLFNRIADAGGRILVQPEHLVKYRIHSSSVTSITSGWDSTMHRWIRQCSINRRMGKPEPTLDEYRAMWRQVPWYRRADQRRRDLANILYNKATFSYSVGNIVISALLVVGSSILAPTNAPRQVWRKYVRPRLFAARTASS
jgi:glycosyltransferase involved in cell wall biosynthesis